MPVKRNPTKSKLHTQVSNEHHVPRFSLSIQNGTEFFGSVIVELFSTDTPKTCELFALNCCNSAEKGRNKQSIYKNCSFKRVTAQAIQTGETIPAAKPVALSELEGEIGRVSHRTGIVSLCRSSTSFDGSQFFICMTDSVAETEHMNSKHVAFGKVVEGMETIFALKELLMPFVGEYGVVEARCPFSVSEITPIGEGI